MLTISGRTVRASMPAIQSIPAPKPIRQRSQLLRLTRAALRRVMHAHPSRKIRCHAYGLLLARRAALVLLLVAVMGSGSYASAQTCTPTPAPGPGWVQQDCGWLPPNHPAIRISAPTSINDCRVLNPYTQPDLLRACLDALPPVSTAPQTFVLGETYGYAPYMSTRTMIVVGRSLGLDGVEIITGQLVLPADVRGQPIAFRNTGTGDATRWVRVPAIKE